MGFSLLFFWGFSPVFVFFFMLTGSAGGETRSNAAICGPPCAKKERPRQTSEAAAKIPFHGSFRMACVRRLAESGPQSPRIIAIIAMALAKIIIATGTATKITMAQRSKTKRDTATAISPIIRPAKNERQDMQKDAAPHLDAHAQLACVQVNFVVADCCSHHTGLPFSKFAGFVISPAPGFSGFFKSPSPAGIGVILPASGASCQEVNVPKNTKKSL